MPKRAHFKRLCLSGDSATSLNTVPRLSQTFYRSEKITGACVRQEMRFDRRLRRNRAEIMGRLEHVLNVFYRGETEAHHDEWD